MLSEPNEGNLDARQADAFSHFSPSPSDPSRMKQLRGRKLQNPLICHFLAERGFASLAAASAHFGLSRTAIGNRLLRGWTPEAAFTFNTKVAGKNPKRPDVVEFLKEHDLLTVTEACNFFGIKRSAFERKIRRGVPVHGIFGVQSSPDTSE